MNNCYFKKGLVLVITALFIGIAISPSITSKTNSANALYNIFTENQEESILVTSKVFSLNKIDEIKTEISIDDIHILDELFKNDTEAFVEKLGELDLLGDLTVKEAIDLLNEKPDGKNIKFSERLVNKNCNLKFSGDIFQIFYLPIPYFLYLLFLEYGDFIFAFIALAIIGFLFILVNMIYIIPRIAEIVINLIMAFVNLLDSILTAIEPLIVGLVNLTVNFENLMGWIHCWSPIKFPLRNTVITSGNLEIETSGDYGYWEKTGTIPLIMMGFLGLWISLPPISDPPYTPTWCIGHARLLAAGR